MIKIAFVIDTIESPTAGTEKQLLLLIKYLDRSRFTPHLCVLRNSKWLQEVFRDCDLFCANITSFKKISGWLGIWRLKEYFRSNKIGIIHLFFRDASAAGAIAAHLAGIRNIIGSRRNQGYWLTGKELLIQKLINNFVTVLIANSCSTKNWVLKTEKLPKKKVKVIYNGIDLDKFNNLSESSKEDVKKELGIEPDTKVVGIVANLRPVKAIDTFLRAAATVTEKGLKNIRFLIVGDGDERFKLESLALNLNLKNFVTFLGKKENIPEILLTFDIGILSSISESFSNSILEYMAAGLAVITTDVGGAKELIDDGINGYIVGVNDWRSMGEKILKLIEDDYAIMFGKNSIRRIDNFTFPKMINSYEKLFVSLVKDKK